MPSASPETAVRKYLAALRDPSSLRDEKKIGELEQRLDASTDEVERLKLRQQLHDAKRPNIQSFEDDFVDHAKGWAEAQGVGEKAFLEEGVTPAVLRRAGFRGVAAGGGRRRTGGTRRPRSRVSAAEVVAAIPKSQFTIKQLQERSGASAAIVRRVVQEEASAGRLAAVGTDRSGKGPGRTPTLYKAT